MFLQYRNRAEGRNNDMMDDFFSFMATTTSQRNLVIIYEEMYTRAYTRRCIQGLAKVHGRERAVIESNHMFTT
jgi:hypothetical protein